jgi:predicted methyltransferase
MKGFSALLSSLALTGVAVTAQAQIATEPLSTSAMIEQAMFGEHRPESHVVRNQYRHPVGTLTFFGVEPGQRVLEIWPSTGWYAGVLAPLQMGSGEYTAAIWDDSLESAPGYAARVNDSFKEWIANNPEQLGEVRLHPYLPPESDLGEADYYDRVLTFRSVHGWVNGDALQMHLEEFFRVLKPGGVLGLVQHRASEGANPKETARLGYVPEAYVIEAAQAAGFELQARSEVNANPKDTKDYEFGVWTLPPSLRGDDDTDAEMLEIGESDRMTLRFVKPAE